MAHSKPEKTGNPIIDAQQERIAESHSHDKNRLRWAIGIALAFHLVFLAVRLPQLAEAEPPEEPQEEPYVIHQVKFEPPPPEPEPEPPPPPEEEPPPPEPDAVKIPIPDPEPEEPEPPPAHEEVVEFVEETEPLEDPVELPTLEVEVEIPAGPPPPPSGPIRVGGDVKPPVKVSGDHPEYTESARAARLEGVVIVEAVIDKQGRVTATKVLKDMPMGLAANAERAVRAWKFKPATLNGKPVTVYYSLTVNYTLN